MKTQGLFILVRLFLFLAIILIALLIVFSFLRKGAYSGNEIQHPVSEERFDRAGPAPQ
jgi:hypothetical protein